METNRYSYTSNNNNQASSNTGNWGKQEQSTNEEAFIHRIRNRNLEIVLIQNPSINVEKEEVWTFLDVATSKKMILAIQNSVMETMVLGTSIHYVLILDIDKRKGLLHLLAFDEIPPLSRKNNYPLVIHTYDVKEKKIKVQKFDNVTWINNDEADTYNSILMETIFEYYPPSVQEMTLTVDHKYSETVWPLSWIL